MNDFATIVNIKRFAVHDGHGIRTTLILKGCPLHCAWCHNPESISPHTEIAYYAHKCVGCKLCERVCPVSAHRFDGEMHLFKREQCTRCGACTVACPSGALVKYGQRLSVEDALQELLRDKIFYEQSGGGVTLSGGEPLLQGDFTLSLLKELKRAGIHTAVDTCGFVKREILEKVLPYTDQFLYDVKILGEEKHRKYTGQSNAIILANLTFLVQRGANIEIRIPLIPNVNDSDEEIRAVGAFLNGIGFCGGVRLLPYNTYAKGKYLALNEGKRYLNAERQNEEKLLRLQAILKEENITPLL